jgi:choline dehydrogenase-like flavoprotein
MSFHNADELAENEMLRADLCIVGAGAAGIALALELESSGLDVILLESGDALPLGEADALNELEIAGHPLNVDVPVRRRCFGGTTVATYGRCVALDDIDFEGRPWLGAGGWPLAASEISAWYPRAARVLDCRALNRSPPAGKRTPSPARCGERFAVRVHAGATPGSRCGSRPPRQCSGGSGVAARNRGGVPG